MKILHFGDIHFWHKQLDLSDCLYPKRWLGVVNLSLRRYRKFPPELAHRIAKEVSESDADVVVFSGDMSTMSLNADFDVAAKAFAPIHEKWGDRFFVIPGNHDRYTPGSVKQQRYEQYFPYGVLDGPDRLVTRRDLDDNLTLVGVDCSEPFAIRSNGIVRERTALALDAVLQAANDDGRTVILVGHFPYDTPPDQQETWSHGLLQADRLSHVIATHNPIAYLHGHKHARWAITPDSTPNTLCINCGSAGMQSASIHKQAGYVTFTVENRTVQDVTGWHFDADSATMATHAVPTRTAQSS